MHTTFTGMDLNLTAVRFRMECFMSIYFINIGAAEIRANKVSEAYNSGNDEDDFGAGDGEIKVGLKELPGYFKVRQLMTK